MKIDIPKGQYFKGVQTTPTTVDVEFGVKKKIALLFICLNDRYWPYVGQVIKDCRANFLKTHDVDYFVWTDYRKDTKEAQLKGWEDLFASYKNASETDKPAAMGALLTVFTNLIRLYEHFYAPQIQASLQDMALQGVIFKREGIKFWLECTRPVVTENDIKLVYEVGRNILATSQADLDAALESTHVIDTDAVPWPSPTLMRYHLFLNEEDTLKDYDYVFYMDADMRVVGTIGDEILCDGLTAAEHPMYSLRKEYIPPYEPNKNSTAYIKRPGAVVDEDGKPRFKPYYYAGGFQGGVAKDFIQSMQVMKKNIDKDFDNNYIAIWNDESHWNKYMSDYEGTSIVLSPAYIYPDSLIKEYYESKIWGRSYEPKIITLTKPFTLSAQGMEDLKKFTQS